MQKPLAIVLDIEATVISKHFYDNIFEYVRKRIELIKYSYFNENPSKEQIFNEYFTEAAYNKYIEEIKPRQNRLEYKKTSKL